MTFVLIIFFWKTMDDHSKREAIEMFNLYYKRVFV